MPPAPARTSSHPPLGHDAAGHPLALPDGTAGWRVKRQTAGRPRVIAGGDGQPVRLPLDATQADLLNQFGPGSYRLDAIDEVGQPLDYVTTWNIGEVQPSELRNAAAYDAPPPPWAMPTAPAAPPPGAIAGNTSDLRFALEVVAQLARTNGEALRSVSSAQAEWIKALANAKAIPRNGFSRPQADPIYLPPPAPLPLPPVALTDQDDDDGDGDGDGDGHEDQEAADKSMGGFNTALAHIATISKSIMPLAQTFLPKPATPPPPVPPPPASPPPRNAAPQVDAAQATTRGALALAQLLDDLSPKARTLTCGALSEGSERTEEWLGRLLAMPHDEAVAYLEGLTVQALRLRRSGPRAAQPTAATEGATAPPEAPEPIDDAAQVQAVMALLSPIEKMSVMALLANIPPEELEAIKAQLRELSAPEAAAWIREQLAARDGADEPEATDGAE